MATRLANRFAELSLHRSETLRRKGMSGLQVDRACKGPPGNGKVGRVQIGGTSPPVAAGSANAADGQPHTQMDAGPAKRALEEGAAAIGAIDRTGGAATHFC